MSILKPGQFRAGVDREYEKVFPLADGAVATDGIQYSAVASFGTTAVAILTKTIDPGFTVKLDKLEVGLTKRFTGLNGSFIGSISYWWTIQPKNYNIPSGGAIAQVSGTTINISGTMNLSVGTLTTADDTLSGYVPVGSVPFAPFEIILNAYDKARAAACTGKVKNSSYVKLIGTVLPGT